MRAPSRLFKLKIEFLPIKEESKRKRGAMVVVKKNIALQKIVQTTHTRGKKMCKSKALTAIKILDDSSSEEKTYHKTHSHKNLPSHPSHRCLMSRGNTKETSSIESDNDNDSDDKKTLMKDLLNMSSSLIKIELISENKLVSLRTSTLS